MDIKTTAGDRIFHGVIMLIITLFCMLVLYPVILIVSGSFSDPFELLSGNVRLFPVKPTLSMYGYVFKHPEIFPSYWNTIQYTVLGTVINVVFTTLGAYPLSRKDFFGRNVFTALFVFTMFFSGGMIPLYLQVRNLHLLNTIWAIVLPGAVSVWNMVIMRTFFQSTIPDALYEAASIDGANDLYFFVKIVLPLSSAIMAVMTLFYGVAHWNSWFPALLYFSSRAKYPLQMILREIILQSSTDSMAGGMQSDTEMLGEGIKYATMVVATVPIICLYPFLQKYFTKGVMVGALKG